MALRIKRIRTYRLRAHALLLLTSLYLLACLPANLFATPIEQIPNLKVYKKTLRKQRKNSSIETLYSKKWFNPGSFYGQAFMQEQGYLLVYDWLAIPSKKYGAITTEAEKEPEYIKTTREYLDDKNKKILITILLPHPRSEEAIKQGLIEEFSKLIPKESEITEKSEITLGEYKATKFQFQAGHQTIVINASRGTMIEVKIDNHTLSPNLMAFVKSFDLKLFNQRLQS